MLTRLTRVAMRLALLLALLAAWQPYRALAVGDDGARIPVSCDDHCKLCSQACAAPCTNAQFPRPETAFAGPVQIAQKIRFSLDERIIAGIDPAPDTAPPRSAA